MPSASWRCCTTALERLPWKRRRGQREGWGRMGVDGGGGETEDFFWDDGDGMAKMVCDWMRLES